MSKKRAVTLRPYIQTRFAYEKLRVGSHCGHFTALWEEQCNICGKGSLITVTQKATSNVKRSMRNEQLIALLIGLIGIFVSQTFLQMILSAVAVILLVALLWFVQRRMLASEIPLELERLFIQEQVNILEDLKHNRKTAVASLKEDELLTYEMLREISTLVQNDKIRLQQVVLLQSFVLRKDMDLTVEPLLIDGFDPDLAAYIGEIAKIKRDLIKNRSIRYILAYEPYILEMEQGIDILTSVAGAAVRLKTYVETYPDFIRRYASRLPKDRFLRLYRIIRQYPDHPWGKLADEVAIIQKELYE
ncbi:hypothetical protein [Paenibacillus crassostreae]|uniref:Uncharacterized protein n=1 Tax=Paenibacillus crassostreae TaxID=1763538 RepID=A0A167BWV9_9BACL|nr:hypothetical protein [Paenibacillus crassostreae]AOZ92585.1 hypothetical protein LPB68_10280 [Paenibacillus crassostreae]OAB72534.1 hypothetical protein PNBC_16725 [Paenibacillus crassostreae]